jgi:glyceraldehyde-3-phosphate dehydrogenase/erythrose-4-phosphate dehydrogenase
MEKTKQQALMDSLTQEQRSGIAEIIRSADVEGDYNWNGEDSFWEEDASATLNSLASYFERYDPKSVLD